MGFGKQALRAARRNWENCLDRPDILSKSLRQSCLLSNHASNLGHLLLCPIIDDVAALTPEHFLIGGSLLSPAEPEEVESKTSLLNRWRRIKLVAEEFCRRWKSEYLKELHRRTKWRKTQEDLRINDLVVLHSDSIGPKDWRLGRVVKLYPGLDNRVQVDDLKIRNGTLTRPLINSFSSLASKRITHRPVEVSYSKNFHQTVNFYHVFLSIADELQRRM